MDTDYLTPMAYETISRADKVLDVLAIEIGASASDVETEDDFLHGARQRDREQPNRAEEPSTSTTPLSTSTREAGGGHRVTLPPADGRGRPSY